MLQQIPWPKAIWEKGRLVSAFGSESAIERSQAKNSSRNLETGLLVITDSIVSNQGTHFIGKIRITEAMEDVAYWLTHRPVVLDSFMST